MLDGTRHGAYHPFCVHSPEWQALRAGFEIGALVRFIDLPWAAVAGAEPPSTATATRSCAARSAVPALCERLGVDDFDAVWDLLVEIDPELTLEEYLRRSELLCAELRAAGVSERRPRARGVHGARRSRDATSTAGSWWSAAASTSRA